MKAPEPPRAVLVTRLRFTGDLILSTPLIEGLARRYPGVAIDYLCEAPHDQVLDGHPDIRQVHTLPDPGLPALQRIGDFWRLVRRLRGRYDWTLDLFANPRSAWITALTGSRLRVGHAPFPRRLAYNLDPGTGPEREPAPRFHLRHLELLAGEQEADPPRIFLRDEERAEGARLLADRGLGGQCVGILTGASQPSKEWPAEHFARLAALLRMGGRFTPVFLGQPGKRERLERIRELSASQVVILPELPLRRLAGVLANLRALVTADGGVMHMALALGLPTLALFGPTDPRIWFPYEGRPEAELAMLEADCRPCHKHVCEHPFCLADLGPEAVAERLAELLRRT